MSYGEIFKQRFTSNIKAMGATVRMMLAARKKLSPRNGVFFTLFMLLPFLSVVLISSPYFALAWIILMIIYFPILEAYAYAVLFGN